MTWNYRIIKHNTGDHAHFAIHEVFYDEENKITSWTTDPIVVNGDSKKDVTSILATMLADIKQQPVLIETELLKNMGHKTKI